MENKVLIAEDETKLRALVVSYLRKEGFFVVEASNGKEALERFYEDKFDLVVLDIMMPIRDGLAVCREIRSQSMVPIVMLTARSEEVETFYTYNKNRELVSLQKQMDSSSGSKSNNIKRNERK